MDVLFIYNVNAWILLSNLITSLNPIGIGSGDLVLAFRNRVHIHVLVLPNIVIDR